MEWMGWMIIFIILMFYSSYPERVKRLEKKLKKITKKEKEEYNMMSQILSSLIGQVCKIRSEDLVFESFECTCTILEVDYEWVKISHTNKKGVTKIRIIRIEDINNIELVENNVNK